MALMDAPEGFGALIYNHILIVVEISTVSQGFSDSHFSLPDITEGYLHPTGDVNKLIF